MTKQLYVTDLREGMPLNGELFLLLDKSVSVTRKGSPYLAFTVGDRTGRIEARYWNVPQDLPGRLTAGEGLQVDATVTSWKGTLQLRIDAPPRRTPRGAGPHRLHQPRQAGDGAARGHRRRGGTVPA